MTSQSRFRRKGEPLEIESMTRLIIGEYVVRIWRTEESVEGVYDNEDLEEAADTIEIRRATPHTIIGVLGQLDRVAAIEVTDVAGNGVVVYMVDWT